MIQRRMRSTGTKNAFLEKNMKIDNIELILSRVEIIQRKYNLNNQISEETWQYYYPVNNSEQIKGFLDKNKK